MPESAAPIRRMHPPIAFRSTIGVVSAIALGLATLPALAASIDQRGEPSPSISSVEIIRDKFGVPHVYANTTYDLFFGYGYALAEDRLFQMEMAKRTVNGRVAEVLGPDYVAHDTAARRLGTPVSIERQLAALPADDRAILEGYTAGINKRLTEVLAPENRSRLLPKQFTDYGFEPEPWIEYDVAMIFVGTMAYRFGDATREIDNLTMLRALEGKHGKNEGRTIFNQMFWFNDPAAPTTVTGRIDDPYRPTRFGALRLDYLKGTPQMIPARRDAPFEPVTASNMLILGARKAADAKAILLNGPQFGSYNPSYVYAVGLHGAGFDLVGNTPFGYPAVLFGHNEHITWGSTAGPNNVVDVYEEQLNPENPDQYLYRGRYLDMERRVETIHVKGAEPVKVEIAQTIHGLVVQRDEKNNVAYAKRRSWDGKEVQGLYAWIRKTQARNWDQWRSAAASNPLPINWYYADREGNIGYASCGLIPDRAPNQSVWLPASGTGDMEWRGFLPFDQNAQAYNPDDGFILNWNNKPSVTFSNSDAWLFSRLDRVNLFFDEMQNRARLSADDLQAINRRASFADVNVDIFLPYLEQAVASLPDASREKRAVALISEWRKAGRLRVDENMDGNSDSTALPIFREWLTTMLRQTFSDEFDSGSPVFSAVFSPLYPQPSASPRVQLGSTNVGYGSRLLVNALLGEAAPVPQKHDFFNGERPIVLVQRALRTALDTLSQTQGSDMEAWRDRNVPHEFNFRNFLGIPQADPAEFLRLPIYMNRGTENNLEILSSDAIRAFDVTPPGQSGFVAPDGLRSEHYDDQLARFGGFDLKPEVFLRADVEASAESRGVIEIKR
ncbi:MAG: penicillin acylase family protein [Microvirga sp.]